MTDFLALIGMLFFMFLLLSAAVEVILEALRGTLERFGITWAKSKLSLDSALALSKEFAPNNTELNTRLEAVIATANQLGARAFESTEELESLREKLLEPDSNLNQIAGELNKFATTIKAELNKNERTRIFIMRFLAAIVGCILCWQSEFYIFQILANAPEGKEWFKGLDNLKDPLLNVLVAGLATAAGSSYWHDQLDKIRSLKAVAGNLKTLK